MTAPALRLSPSSTKPRQSRTRRPTLSYRPRYSFTIKWVTVIQVGRAFQARRRGGPKRAPHDRQLRLAIRRLAVRDREQHGPDEIDHGTKQDHESDAARGKQHRHRETVAQFLEDREQHQPSLPDRVLRNIEEDQLPDDREADRKSTRLNSSHL